MRVFWSFAATLTLFVVSSCSRSSQSADAGSLKPFARACRTAPGASAGKDTEIERLQQALRDERTPSRAAEQLGYRFITRARLSNDAGFYTLAEQAALCMASLSCLRRSTGRRVLCGRAGHLRSAEAPPGRQGRGF